MRYKYRENGNKIILVGYQPFSASKNQENQLKKKKLVTAINELGGYKINIQNIKDFLKHKQ